MSARRYLLTGLAALYFAGLIGLTFMPGSAAARASWFWPFIFFVPVGVLFLLLLGRRRWWLAVGLGCLGAAWIEAAQAIWMPEGYASESDLLWASVGVAAGVAIVLLLGTGHRKSMHSHESHRIVAQGSSREIP